MQMIARPKLDHVQRLFGNHGIIQFSQHDVPDLDSGFCLDDNVRLLILAVTLRKDDPHHPFGIEAGNVVFDFIEESSKDAPLYHNMMDQHGRFTDRFASPESIGRLIWSLGVVMRDSRDPRWLARAQREMRKAMSAVPALSSEHARAFAALGWSAAVEAGEVQYRAPLCAVAEAMHFEFERNAKAEWDWVLPELTYDKARLPEALLRAGRVLDQPEIYASGERALEFLAGVVQSNGMYVPVGAPGWYARGGERPYYSQQPLEAVAMMDAWLAHGDIDDAYVAYEWYMGRNTDDLVVADTASGGCRDAIHERGKLNPNMGAESTLAYLQAATTLGQLRVSEVESAGVAGQEVRIA
jgi:hypothetical protein